jgi:hypothetical protein
MRYTKDEYDKDLLLADDGFQVMMEWEKPYMQALIKELNPTGDVLEIGFGLGYSSNEIQKYDISTHTIVEDNPVVLKKLYKWAGEQKHEVIVVEGSWQNVLDDLKTFDSIFLDDAPSAAHIDKTTRRFYQFYSKIAKSHVNKNAKFTWYCDRNTPLAIDSNIIFYCKKFDIQIPDNVKYVPSEISNFMYVPIVQFTEGSNKEIKLFGLDPKGNFSVMY